MSLSLLEKEALVLYKDHSLLVLKSFKTEKATSLTGYEQEVINQAMDYHRFYRSYKLKKAVR